MAKLTLADIADARAYERERDDFRRQIIELKKKRRISIGPYITTVFESTETMRFQIQEMARVERMYTDEAIQTELDIYNPLIPAGGRLPVTLFIELTTDELLREWLPKLVGIERSIELRFADRSIRCAPEAAHEEQLTRDEMTAAVHYVNFDLDAADIVALADFVAGGGAGATLAVVHENYQHETALSPETMADLAVDAAS